MPNKKNLIIIFVFIAAAALLIGSFWYFRSDNTPTGRTKLRIGYLPSLAASQMYVAIANGDFAKEGIDVDIKEIYSGPEIIQAIQSKSVDIGFGVLPSVALARGQQVPVRSLVGATTDSGTFREHRIIVPKDSPIQKAEDLRGKRIALVAEPTSDGLALFEFLERYGIAKTDVTIVRTPHPEMLVAVSTGAVDAAAALEPFITEGQLAGRTREIAYYYPDNVTEVGTYIVNDDWLSLNKDVAERFSRAIRSSTVWINEDPNRFRGLLSQLENKGIRFKISEEAAQKLSLPGFREKPTAEGVNELVRLLQKYGFLKQPVDANLILPNN